MVHYCSYVCPSACLNLGSDYKIETECSSAFLSVRLAASLHGHVRRQTFIWTNAGLLLSGHMVSNFSGISSARNSIRKSRLQNGIHFVSASIMNIKNNHMGNDQIVDLPITSTCIGYALQLFLADIKYVPWNMHMIFMLFCVSGDIICYQYIPVVYLFHRNLLITDDIVTQNKTFACYSKLIHWLLDNRMIATVSTK